jgi:hypothetical protein
MDKRKMSQQDKIYIEGMMNLIKTMEETLERKNSNETKIREFRATP